MKESKSSELSPITVKGQSSQNVQIRSWNIGGEDKNSSLDSQNRANQTCFPIVAG